MKLIFLTALLVIYSTPSKADNSVFVKYRGDVNLKHFECFEIKPSSLVKNLCYDGSKEYLF